MTARRINVRRRRLAAMGGAAAITAWLAAAPGTADAATFFVPCFGPNGGAAGLVNAINMANGNGMADTIELAPLCTYTLTTVNNTTGEPNGLPVITSDITIDGNGATIQRSFAPGTPDFRILAAHNANLVLSRVTIRNGHGVSRGAGVFDGPDNSAG